MLVFFFKQKTAYEMRISDWSSDVCSSDLRRAGFRQGVDRCAPALSVRALGAAVREIQLRGAQRRVARIRTVRPRRRCIHRCGKGSRRPLRACRQGLDLDRKSVVSGKRVSVRVNLGGCPSIKKKTNTHNRLMTDSTLTIKTL